MLLTFIWFNLWKHSSAWEGSTKETAIFENKVLYLFCMSSGSFPCNIKSSVSPFKLLKHREECKASIQPPRFQSDPKNENQSKVSTVGNHDYISHSDIKINSIFRKIWNSKYYEPLGQCKQLSMKLEIEDLTINISL